jgi:Cu+-exporting ATPase
VEIRLAGDLSRELALALAASLESHGDHPVAREIVRRAEEEGLPPVELAAVRVSENGIAGVFRGAEVKIGSAGFAAPQLDGTHVAALGGGCPEHSSVFLTVAGRLGAVFLFGDRIRGAATETVQGLRSMGFPIALVSGDGEATTAAIARRIGITEAHGSLLPSAKAAYVAELQREGRIVAMVGDGINDAPALARADVGIAIGTGTDVAMETGQVTLVRGDLRGVATAIGLSRATLRVIRQNLFWAFIYNVVGIPLAAFGLLNPIIAGSAMAMSSISVVMNALLLKRWRPGREEES